MAKTVPISLRISSEDAEFIANLQANDAITPSEKIRSLIKNAKKQQAQVDNYEHCLKSARESLRGLTQTVKATELNQKQHSELVNLFNEWITESFAYVKSAKQEIDEGKLALEQLEEGVSERVFRLFEVVTRMGVTAKAPCYDKDIISKNLAAISELIQIINQRIEKEKKND